MTTTPEPTCAGCAGCGGPDCIERPEPVTPEQEAELRRLAATQEVQGRCPACGGTSLFLGDGGFLTCSRLDCPAPDAASTLLERDPLRTPEPAPAAAGQVVTAADIRRFATHDLQVCAAERAAHEEHRRQLAAALGRLPIESWDYLIGDARHTERKHRDAERALHDARNAHEAHRGDLSEALGLGTSGPWDAVLYCATKTHAAATERGAALHDARDALGTAGHGPAADDWPAVAPAIRALAERAGQMQRSRNYWKRGAEQLAEDLAAARTDVQHTADRLTAKLTAAQAENDGLVECMRNTDRITTAEVTKLRTRAEEAEAAITRVRATVVQWRGWNPAENAWAIRDIERALSGEPDPQPQDPAALDGEQAAEPEPDAPCFHPSWETYGRSRKCTDCGEWLDPEPPNPDKPEPEGDTTTTRTLTIHITAPTQSDADRWAQTITDHVIAEYGDSMRLRIAATDRPATDADEPEPEPELIPILDYTVRRLATAIRRALKEHP